MSRLWTLLRGSILHYIRAQFPDHPTYPYTEEARQAARANLREYANTLQRLVGTTFLPPALFTCQGTHLRTSQVAKHLAASIPHSFRSAATNKACAPAPTAERVLVPCGLQAIAGAARHADLDVMSCTWSADLATC